MGGLGWSGVCGRVYGGKVRVYVSVVRGEGEEVWGITG